MQKFLHLIRIVEHNNWVIISLFLSILALVLTFSYLNRGASIQDFILRKKEETSNITLSWIIFSVVFFVQISVLLSQYVPIVPRVVDDFSILGLSLNKLGYVMLIFGSFYLIKIAFSFFFYLSINQMKYFENLQFIASRLYFVGSVVMMILVFVNYFFDLERSVFLMILLGIIIFLFIFKNISYLINGKENLPKQWYYKLLYICLLQIAPLFAVWKLVFFN